MAAVDNVVRSSAVYAGDFGREGGEKGTELVGNLDAVYQAEWNWPYEMSSRSGGSEPA